MSMPPPNPSGMGLPGETNPRLDQLKRSPMHNKPWVYVAAPIATLVIVIGLLWASLRPEVTLVPKLTGIRLQDALDAVASDDGCVWGIDTSDGPMGMVLNQVPAPGTAGDGRSWPVYEVHLTVGARTDIKAIARPNRAALCPGFAVELLGPVP